MMILLRTLMKKGRGRPMDPLHVSMTGVRMGERFLQIGCHDLAFWQGSRRRWAERQRRRRGVRR